MVAFTAPGYRQLDSSKLLLFPLAFGATPTSVYSHVAQTAQRDDSFLINSRSKVLVSIQLLNAFVTIFERFQFFYLAGDHNREDHHAQRIGNDHWAYRLL
jgi:hypothetical protein